MMNKDKLRAAIQALSRPPQPRMPVVLPPSLGELAVRDYPELFTGRPGGPPLFVVSKRIDG